MKELTIQGKIQILKNDIKHLKRKTCYGMCASIALGIRDYNKNILTSYADVYDNYPDFTHDNYMKFYRFNKTVKLHAECSYWDNYSRKIIPLMRRIIFLRYLILKLRIQQIKRWYTTLR